MKRRGQMDLAHPGRAQGDHVFLAPDTIEIEQTYDLPDATLTANREIRIHPEPKRLRWSRADCDRKGFLNPVCFRRTDESGNYLCHCSESTETVMPRHAVLPAAVGQAGALANSLSSRPLTQELKTVLHG
jgi:hypothetical protein